MKILTLNTHSLQEENGLQKMNWVAEKILEEKPDIIALQEVSQTAGAPEISPQMLAGLYPIPGTIPIRQDNYAAHLANLLNGAGLEVSWAWLPVKLGFEKYDEGIAILSPGRRICRAEPIFISRDSDYRNWKTRAALAVQTEGWDDWFCTVHMGWWNDAEEPFAGQWDKLNRSIADKARSGQVWLMGDFNAPDNVRGEGYDMVAHSGWWDAFLDAREKDTGITVPGVIDGWRGEQKAGVSGLRLDYIWCRHRERILSSRVLFNGENGPVVSDHFAVCVETAGRMEETI